MKKNKVKIVSILLIALSVTSIGINSYAHSGRTDSSGGHKDNNNKSGLGSYHYHCGGNPAHLHTNGVCAYSSSSPSSKSSTSNFQSSSTQTTTTVPSTVAVTGIQINENIESLEVGKRKIITASSSNGKTSTIKIDIKEDSNPLGGILTLGLLGGGGYWIYKKSKK